MCNWLLNGCLRWCLFSKSDLEVWHTLNALRLICAILAWLVLASDETIQPVRAVIDYEAEHKREHGSNSIGASGSAAPTSA